MTLVESQFAQQELSTYSGQGHREYEPITGRDLTVRAMVNLAVSDGAEVYYVAADPGYRNSFTRDSLITMSLCGEADTLKSQIDYSARRLGKVQNPETGEEPGKAHHELPDVLYKGRSTAYNACDTTAELLRGVAVLAETGHDAVVEQYAPTIREGVAYVRRHVNHQGLFIEDPLFAGITDKDGQPRQFALKVTDWKDSELNRIGRREPNYPIVYSLVHFQNAEALMRIGKATGDERLARQGRYMVEAGLQHLWNGDHFVSAIDRDGAIDPPSSDSLHALLHIPPELLPLGYAQKIEQYSRQLETAAGYRAGIPVAPDVDPYHMQVWTHEQALLNAAARKHNLYEAEAVTRRIQPFIKPEQGIFPEIINPVTLQPDGNMKQLWAMGAYLYFQNSKHALL